MARAPQYHKIPSTSRVAVTLSTPEIKELRKMAIDLEMPEHEVFRLALLLMIHRYQNEPLETLLGDIKNIADS